MTLKISSETHRFGNWAFLQNNLRLRLHLITALLILSSVNLNAEGLSAPQSAQAYGLSPEWLRLLYYEKDGSTYRSLASGARYFLDPKGPTDPVSELNTTLYWFRKSLPAGNTHPQCLYPSRYMILRKHFELAKPVPCPQLDEWKKSYQPNALHLVYASQYIANPASVFGHSFLALESKAQTKSLWLTYNFAANIAPDTSGPAYIWGGLAGWFKGDYSIMPLYHRLYQYGSVEDRHLWFYQLKLSKSELDLFLGHLWELVHTAQFTYYFLDDNCAGILMRTFSALLPDVAAAYKEKIANHPLDVVKNLYKLGRIEKLELHPSQSERLEKVVSRLNGSEYDNFRFAIKHKCYPNSDNDLSLHESEALIEYIDFLTQQNEGEVPVEYKDLEKIAYIKRATYKTPVTQQSTLKTLESAPHLAHDTYSIDFTGSSRDSDTGESFTSIDFGFRFAIHEGLDPDPGFIPNSSIEIFKLDFSLKDDDLWIKNGVIAGIENLRPYLGYKSAASWRARLVYLENLLTEDLNDGFTQLDGAYGMSLAGGRWQTYALANFRINTGAPTHYETFVLGTELGGIFNLSRKLKLRAHWAPLLALFEGGPKWQHQAELNWNWNFHKEWSLIQRNQWVRHKNAELATGIQDEVIEASRHEIGFRHFF